MGKLFQSDGVSLGALRTFQKRFGTKALLDFLSSEKSHEDFSLRLPKGFPVSQFRSNWDRGAFYHLVVSWPKIEKLARAAAKVERPVILDVGANLGVFSLFAKVQFLDADIHAFEPSQTVLPLLKKNIGSFATVNGVAVGNSTATTMFYESPDQIQASSLRRGAVLSERTNNYEVSVIRLEEYLEKNSLADRPLIVKIDVQGTERDVVEGLGKYKDSVFAFLLESSWLDEDSIRVAFELTEAGWSSKVINLLGGGADLLMTRRQPHSADGNA